MTEVLVYNRALTSAEQQQVEGYLADKYGVYDPNATWSSAYSSDVRAMITANQWNKSQADAYVAFAATSPAVPSAGLSVWLKADDSTHVTADPTSGLVSQWTDETFNQNNANQGNTANQPTLVSNSLNGEPMIRFNGSTSYLDITDNSSLRPSSGVTVYALIRPNGTSYGDVVAKALNFWFTGWDPPLYTYDLGLGGNNAAHGYLSTGTFPGSSNDLNGSVAQDQRAQITALVYDGTTATVSTGGTIETSESLTGSLSYSPGLETNGAFGKDLIIGAAAVPTSDNRYIPTNFFNGDVAEVLVYSRPLTTTEQQQVEGYLADKYGVYDPNSTWPSAYSSDVQALITANQWNKSQADDYVAFAATDSATPSAGLSVWFKADDSTHITADPTSGLVSQWADETFNQNNANQGTTANQPTLVSNSLNGKPVIRFNGSTSYLDITDNDSVRPSGAVTVLAVVRPNQGSGNGDVVSKALQNFFTGWAAPLYSYDLGVESSNFSYGYLSASGGSSSAEMAGSTSFDPKGEIMSLAYDSTNTTTPNAIVSVNGAIQNAATLSGAINYGDTSKKDMLIGAANGWGGIQRFFNGDVAEVMVYNQALTATQQQEAEGYLADKYGIYDPDATWLSAYSEDLQALIILNQWSKDQVDQYVALQGNTSGVVTNGLMLWLRADAGVTHDSSGNVSAIVDQAGNSTLTQGNLANEPTFVSSDSNSQPALRFTGTQWLSGNSDAFKNSLNADITIVTVGVSTNLAGQTYSLYLGQNNSTGQNRAAGCINFDELFDALGVDLTGAPASSTFSTEMTMLDSTLSYVSFYQNGVLTTTGSVTGVQTLSPGMTLGAAAGGVDGWQGDISEVLVYNHQLSASIPDRIGYSGLLRPELDSSFIWAG